MTTNVIMHSNVIQIDHKCNKTDKCFSNGIYWKERRPQYKSDKISAAALIQKAQYPIAFNRKRSYPEQTSHVLNRKEISAGTLFRKIQCFTALNRKGADLKLQSHMRRKKTDSQIRTL